MVKSEYESVTQNSDSPRSSPRLSRGSNGENGKLRKRKTAREEAEIDLLADRLTSDIISHATYNGQFFFEVFGGLDLTSL